MSGRPAFIATCSRGLEPLLEAELRELEMPRVRRLRGAVVFGASLQDGYRALLQTRLASRVLLEVNRFPCPDADHLYDGVRAVDWSDHLTPRGTLAVDFVGGSSQIRHNQFGARRVKDAIVDQFRDRGGVRPDVDLDQPDVRVNVHLDGRSATVSIDLAGRALHERGFGRDALEAPIKETLAAAVLRIAGWTQERAQDTVLADPFCGSGTILSEAALIGLGIAPGLQRRFWGFDHWAGHQAALWSREVDAAREEATRNASRSLELYGSDVSGAALTLARRNLRAAGVDAHVRLARRAVSDVHPPSSTSGMVVTNPPYGVRLEDLDGANACLASLGDVLRRRFLGWEAWVLVGSPQQSKALGLRPRRRHEVRNGPLDARLLEVPIADKAPDSDAPGWR